MKTRLVVFFICLLRSFICLAQPVILADTIQQAKTITEVLYLCDSAKQFTINQISSPEFSKLFRKTNTVDECFKESVNYYWLKFDIKNNTGQDDEWLLDFDNWLYVNCYVKDSSGSFINKVTGHFVSYVQRDFPAGNKNLVLLKLKQGQIFSCFVQLQTNKDFTVRPVNLNFKIYPKTFFEKSRSRQNTVLALFVGIYTVIFLYNFFIFISTKDKNYVFYLIIIVINLIAILQNFGYSVELLKGIRQFVFWFSKIDVTMSSIYGTAILLFTIKFLKVDEHFPLMYKFFKGIMIALVIVLIPAFTGNTFLANNISSMIGLITLLSVLIVAIRSYVRKYPSSGYFLFAHSAFIGGLMVFLLKELGALPTTGFTYYSTQIGSSVEAVLFSFALANRINILKNDNDLKQANIIHQLKENELLQTKVNRELEEKVQERTFQIRQQKEIIEMEKEKSEQLLLNILPKETADELKIKNSVTPRQYEMVTVLFIDFKGFTALSEKMSASELVRELDFVFKKYDEIISKYPIEKIKTIGDAYMCAGGLPVENTTNPVDVVMAALEIQEWMAEQKLKFQNPEPQISLESENQLTRNLFDIRLGIHTGPIIAGVVGDKKFAYDIWGDTVNTASRMESSGETNKVNISSSTYNLIKDQLLINKHQLKIVHRGKVEAKHKGEIDMYFVERTNA